MTSRLTIALVPLALLAACNKGQPNAAVDAKAAGEILPGSASDAMLPMDAVTSAPPLAPHSDPSAKPAPKARGGAAPAASDAPAAPAPEEPAAAAT